MYKENKLKDTKIVYVSGVHGSGKTTLVRGLAQRMQKSGLSVYVFPEMTYLPDIPIGTMEFQHWYMSMMGTREYLVEYLMSENVYDYIICDRHPIDVSLYTLQIIHSKNLRDFEVSFVRNRDSDIYLVVQRDKDVAIKAIKKRMETEAHREEWNEDNEDYYTNMIFMFDGLANDSETHIIENNNDVNDAISAMLVAIMREVI